MNLKNNLFKNEKHIRFIIGTIFIILAIYLDIWWIAVFALASFITSAYNYCPMYDITGINDNQSKRNYYLSQFPLFNPEPVLLFKEDGNMDFTNSAGKDIFKDIKNLNDVFPTQSKEPNQLIQENASIFNTVKIGDLSYMIHFKGVSEIRSILAFAFNVTAIVKMNEEIINTQKDIVYKMGEIGETRSKETGNHVKRVAEYSYLLAIEAGLSQEEAETLKIASPMHDIGKVAIPDNVLKKPGKLNLDEWKIMQTHAQLGYEMLKGSSRPILKTAAIVAQQHHEKWDGSGYPNATAKENIHIYGRITAIADVFDALGSKRVYKDAWELEKILELFKEERGKQFDPKLVDIMFENFDKFLEIRDRYQDV
jgi:HD-GYP domain-containing protein (c-di-GMP phosphodiesterase class II)